MSLTRDMDKAKNEKELTVLASNTIRLLAADAVQKANSGHPGLPMGLADCAYVLWTKFLKFNPAEPNWPNRDRFVLSAGHGSMLLYSMLYLCGYDVTMHDLKNFRQWEGRTPGHPEVHCLPGVETTTGPLGQGFANAVGMAIAAKMTAARFNGGQEVLGAHRIFGFCSDGDMMEGVASEAASLAGHLQLDNLVFLYDDNKITIAGETDLAFSENVAARFEAYGWHTLHIDGHDYDQIEEAFNKAIAVKGKPVLIVAKTHIGHGSPNKHDTAGVHGSPLGADELRLTKQNLGFNPDVDFHVPDEVQVVFDKRVEQLKEEYQAWEKEFAAWKKEHPEKAKLYKSMMERELPDNLEKELLAAAPEKETATRGLSGKVMQKIADLLPGFVGGSADLEPSTKTYLDKFAPIKGGSYDGRNLHFGIREHAMAAICNGISLYGGYIPFGSTFLVFSDYMRPSMRLAALMEAQNVFVFTHDSIFVGEDGPTHQPIEHLAALRAILNLQVMRPADAVETAMCWAMALRKKDGPSALLLTRQNVPVIARGPSFSAEQVKRGAYVVSDDAGGKPEVVLMASGSELHFAVDAAKILRDKGHAVRVVSVPCKELFEQQPENYRRELIPASVKNIFVVEAGVSFGWSHYFGLPVHVLGMERFGASAPYEVLEEKFGFSGEQVAARVEKEIKG